MKLPAPVYLVIGEIACWKCKAPTAVAGLLAERTADEDIPCMVSEVACIDDGVLAFIQSHVPNYRLGYSKMAGESYLANHCPSCGIIQGDFFLHSEPGGPFFPVEPREAAELNIVRLPVDGDLELDAALHRGGIELILNNAQPIKY